MSEGRAQLEWAEVLFASLADAGVTDVVLSPGSRSTPLVLGALATPRLRLHEVIDERSAAFYALGQARVTGRPSVCVCTSGTAAAHYLPAVVEAHLAGVPLVLLTADRPLEVQDAGALQTIDQVKLFGDHARAYVELGVAEGSRTALLALRRKAAQAVFTALHPRPGAVQVNARARKPLEPSADELRAPRSKVVDEVLARPIPRAVAPLAVPPPAVVEALASRLAQAERPVLLVGPGAARGARAAEVVAALSARFGLVTFAEATSGLRFAPEAERAHVVAAHEALLRQPALRAAAAPDFVLQLGPTLTSGGVELWLGEHGDAPRTVVWPNGWQDPLGTASELLFTDVEATVRGLLAAPAAASARPAASEPWRAWWAAADRAAKDALRALTAVHGSSAPLTEGAVTRELLRSAPRGAHLVVGNGLPIRHLDTFGEPGSAALDVLCQRGASGIDGLVSGAAGAGSVSEGTVVLYTGDVSVLHDLGALAVARRATRPLVLVVINNDGGRIFEQLPIARLTRLGGPEDAGPIAPRTLDWFTTPHGLHFAGAAEMFGVAYRAAHDLASLTAALAAAYAHPGPTLVEAVVPPHEAEQTRAALADALGRSLAELAARNRRER